MSRVCEYCEKALVQHPKKANRRAESNKDFKARVFCSVLCMAKSMTKDIDRTCAKCCKKIVHRRRSAFCDEGCARSYTDRNGATMALPEPADHTCKYCKIDLVRGASEGNCKFVKRLYCGRECHGKDKEVTVDILGVTLSTNEIATITGIKRSAVSKRIRNGLNPLTGKRKS